MLLLTERERADLTWMKKLNDEFGTSLYWPTIRKSGPVQECEELVRRGLAERYSNQRHKEEQGYWITDEGRAALQQTPGA